MICLGFAACNQSNEVVDELSFSVTNLPALAPGAGHYQMWVRYILFNKASGENSPLHEGDYISIGEFNVGDDGTPRSLNGESAVFSLPAGHDPQLLSDVVIAVQGPGDLAKVAHEEPGPILIGGKFYGDASTAIADLDMKYTEALKSDFSSVTGRCTITSPTSPPDSNSGIWFVESGSAPTTGLKNLPLLPAAWKYEGWVVDQTSNTYYSTGKFSRADSADYDGAGPNSDTTGTGYNFPGQDFVRGAFRPDLTSAPYSFRVTVEPFPDNSNSPFFLHLLKTSPPSTVTRTQTLQNVASVSAPSARIVIQR